MFRLRGSAGQIGDVAYTTPSGLLLMPEGVLQFWKKRVLGSCEVEVQLKPGDD